MREIQNNPIRGASRRAIQQTPDSLIVQKINQDNQDQAAERISLEEDRQFAQLRKRFERVGLMWYGTEIDKSTGRSYGHNLIPIEQKKEHYVEALTTLKNRPSEQRIKLLRALASGMRLTENNTFPAAEAKYSRFFRFAPLGYSGDNPLRVSFTRPSRDFIEAVGNMSGHSREQQEKFREFMVRKAGLKGKVGLPQLLHGISRWLDHSTSLPPRFVKPT